MKSTLLPLVLALFTLPAIAQTDTTTAEKGIKKPVQESTDRAVTPKPNPFQQMGSNLDLTLFG